LKAKPNCSGNSVIKAFLPTKDGLFQVDFYQAKSSTFGILLLVRTGSANHNIWPAGHSFSKGMRLKYSDGLIKDDVAIAGDTEQGVFEALNLPCPLPSKREIVEGKPVWMLAQQ
jgi:DNA polymerase/3'-5' exonuclease PolX